MVVGQQYLLSLITSIFTKSVWQSSRARRAMRTASSALRAPLVLGSKVTFSGT